MAGGDGNDPPDTTQGGTTFSPLIPALPRVGGTDPSGNVWVGGSNVDKPKAPVTLRCMRPSTMKEARFTERDCRDGIPEELRLKTPEATLVENSSAIPLTSWIRALRTKVEETGQDTVFRVYDATENTEVYILKKFGELTIEAVSKWVSALRNGVPKKDGGNEEVCTYDVANLRNTASMIQSSIDIDMWNLIDADLLDDLTGPELFTTIVAKFQTASTTVTRNLIHKLSNMTIKKEPAEDVEKFGAKIVELCRRIVGTGDEPKDLSFLVAQAFIGSSNNNFDLRANELFNLCQDKRSMPEWEPMVRELRGKYIMLKQNGLWEAANHQKVRDELQGMKAEIKTLKGQLAAHGGGAKGNQGAKDGKETRTCYNCGKEGHLSANCPEPKKAKKGKGNGGNGNGNNKNGITSPFKKAPGEGESHSKSVEGVAMKWCAKCKRWTKGEKAHLTAEHKTKEELQRAGSVGSVPAGNLSAALQASESTNLRFLGGFMCLAAANHKPLSKLDRANIRWCDVCEQFHKVDCRFSMRHQRIAIENAVSDTALNFNAGHA